MFFKRFCDRAVTTGHESFAGLSNCLCFSSLHSILSHCEHTLWLWGKWLLRACITFVRGHVFYNLIFEHTMVLISTNYVWGWRDSTTEFALIEPRLNIISVDWHIVSYLTFWDGHSVLVVSHPSNIAQINLVKVPTLLGSSCVYLVLQILTLFLHLHRSDEKMVLDILVTNSVTWIVECCSVRFELTSLRFVM